MILLYVVFALIGAFASAGGAEAPPLQMQPPASVRPLYATGSVRDSLAGAESATFSFDVPAHSAARIVATQEGIDITLKLWRQGSERPTHGLDFVAGPDGEEVMYPAVLDAAANWIVVVSASQPRASRGDFALSFALAPADDHARAIAAARARHYAASETSWAGGDGVNRTRARDEYAAAAADGLAAGDLVQTAESTYQSARERDNLGDTPDALAWQRRALDLFRQAGRRDREARVLNRLGDLSRKLGEVIESERYFQQALPIAREVRDPAAIAEILNNSGLLLLALGRFEDGIEQLSAAIPQAQALNSADLEGALLHNIGDGYLSLGVYDKAIDAFQQSIAVKVRLNLPRRTARSLHALSMAYFEHGDRAKAEDAIRTTIDLYEKSADTTGMAEAMGFLGLMQHASGDTDRALESFARVQPMLRDVGNRSAESRVLTAWANVDVDRGAAAAALPKLEEALRLARLVASPALEQQALYVRALALRKTERLDDAIGSIGEVIDGVEAMRGAIRRTELRTSYLATVRKYFDLYIDLLQQRGSVAEAFEMSERARARTLLEGLAQSASKIAKGVDLQLIARQRAVQTQLNAKEAYRAQMVLADGEKSARAVAADREVRALLEQWTDVRAQIRAASPAYAALQQPEPISTSRVQRALLDEATALVEYHVGEARSYAWVVDRASITAHALPAAATIGALARRHHELMSRETDALPAAERDALGKEIATLGRRLAALVWTPVEARVRGRRVLLVADGALQYVAFAALPGFNGEPLLARHELVYLPSASVLDTIRRESRPVPASATAAVFADPVFSKNDQRFAAARDAAAPTQTRAADGGLYGRLRFSRREAETIAAVSPGAFEALDFSAAKQTLLARDLRQYRILHFATHGSLNTEHPELSGLVFSLVDKAGKPIDGFLRLHEIYNLDLNADLVVLSACRTALGKEVHGEGLIGLTRGFMYAGASRVVSTVWNVDDRASSLLMSRFYTEMLSRHLPPAAALRAAQLSLLREPRWANPHYWAAFGLHGEWQ